MMAEDATGRWAARTTGRAASRQNGKGDEVEVVESWGLTQRGEAIAHTAHEIPTAKSAHLRLVAHLERHRDLRRLVKRVGYANGDQTIRMTAEAGDGLITYRTRTGGGLRGLDDISRLVVDEAQHAEPEQLASATPIMAANPNPQTNLMGSAGIEGRSAFWWSMRRRGIEPDPDAPFSWLEHSAEVVTIGPDGVVSTRPDPMDEAGWRKANSGYPERIDHGFLLEQYRILGPDLFAREHECVWDPEPSTSGQIIPAHFWSAAGNPGAVPGDPCAYAVDVTPDLLWASIACSDGRTSIVCDRRSGTFWIPAALAELRDAHPGPVFVDPKGPVASILTDLAPADPVEVSPAEHAKACGGLLAAVLSGTFSHACQPALDAAIAGATRRPYGDAWAWNRRTSAVDISPLVAVTIARWGALTFTDGPSAYEDRGLMSL